MGASNASQTSNPGLLSIGAKTFGNGAYWRGLVAAWLGLFSLAGLAADLVAQEAASKASKGKAIIILDASGSMWGTVPGGVKIDIAKKVIADLVPSIADGVEIGLMAYGHRKKGDCEDIELLVPPGAGNREAILKAVQGIVPKGKTPLCDSVLMAANYLKFGEDKASVILVSDGIETCGKDPCAVGAQLAAQGIDFVCHVVAFDIAKEKNAGLDCLSSETGGLYLEAKDADGLKDALNQAVQTVVMKETALILSGQNSKGELLDGVNFEIYQGEEAEAPLYKGSGGKFRTVLEPGEYTVRGTFGKLKAESSLKVPEGKTGIHVMTFEATGLTAHAVLVEGGEPIKKRMGWQVFSRVGEERKMVANSYQAEPTFQLAPGKYILRAKHEESSAEVAVEVLESKASDVTVVLGSGTLVAQARMSENSEPLTKGLGWTLFHAEADSEGDLRQVTYSYEAKTNLVVPVGKYLLRAKYKQTATQKEVEVKGGERTEVMLTFGAGTLVTKAVLSEGGEPLTKGLAWTLFSQPNAEGERKQVAYGFAASEEFKVPSGEYLLRVKRGSATVEADVVVAAGEKTERTLNLNAGIWKGQAFMDEAATEPVTKDTAWKVLSQPNAEGVRKQVAYSYSSADYTLPAGSYSVELKRGAAVVRKEITVSPGKVTNDKLVLNAGVVKLITGGGQNPGVQVYSAGQESKQAVTYGYGKEHRFYLPAGDYRVEFKRKVGGEEKKTTSTFTVEAGKFLEMELK
jgi:Ca-activated chloride channel family protein